MDYDENFEEDVLVTSEAKDKFREGLRQYSPPDIVPQLLLLYDNLVSLGKSRHAIISSYAQLPQLVHMNMKLLSVVIFYVVKFKSYKPIKEIPESDISTFLEEYYAIILGKNIRDYDKKVTPQFKFNVKINFSSYLKVLEKHFT